MRNIRCEMRCRFHPRREHLGGEGEAERLHLPPEPGELLPEAEELEARDANLVLSVRR